MSEAIESELKQPVRTRTFQMFLDSLPGGDLTKAQKLKIENAARKKARGWGRDPKPNQT